MKSRAVRLAIAAVMLVLVVLYARRVQWSAIGTATADASIALLALSALGNVPLIWLKAQRMRLLVASRVASPRLMAMYVASYAADNLVMSQAGLGVRVAMLRKDGVPLASAVTSQAVEKVLEGVSLAVLAVPVLATLELQPELESSLRWFAIGGGIVVALAAVAALVWRRKLRVVQRLADVLAMLRDPALAAKLLALSVAAWIVEVAILLCALWALHVHVPGVVGPTLVLLAVNLAALVPGLPANIGPFEAACVLALGTFGAAQDHALGFALIYHALHTIPVTLVGLPLLHRATRTVV
ncbi:MAG TPA: lysylphosphatidylglycerol synthase transmembrane domain-containing protein [Kofleriaceae bacterium]